MARASHPRLSLEFDPSTFALQVTFVGPNVECAMAMLTQAHRQLEAQWRAAKAMELQQQMREQAENALIARRVAGKG